MESHIEAKRRLLQLQIDAQNQKVDEDQFVSNIVQFLTWVKSTGTFGSTGTSGETRKNRQLEMSKTLVKTLFNEMALRTNKPMKWKLSKKLQKERDDIIEIVSKEILIFPTPIASKNLIFDYTLFTDALRIWSGGN